MFTRIQVFLGRALVLDAEDLKRQEGQTVTEYAVVLGVLLVGLGAIVLTLKDSINTFIGKVGTALNALIP
jgi:Flp pilus assembly pilin Flp